MRIVSLTMASNECEIIESFVRYNSCFVDKMIIVSSCCIDGTCKIIKKLIKEGYSIELIEEYGTTFDQRVMDNKYIRSVAEKGEYDLIVPLDADEFLYGSDNPRKIMEGLPLDKVYEINWINYVMTELDNLSELFIPRRIVHRKKNDKNSYKKVLIPTAIVKEKALSVGTGRHAVMGNDICIEGLEHLSIAHFPTTSEQQYLVKVYGNCIKRITWTNYGNGEGSHINRQFAALQNGKNCFEVAGEYEREMPELQLEVAPLELSFCEDHKLSIQYGEYAKINVIEHIMKIGQIAAIRAYNYEISEYLNNEKKNILIYGTGYGANTLFNGLPQNIVNVLAYIDSDYGKCFQMHDRRLVIPPEYIHFFLFDEVIISSSKHYNEMRDTLLKYNVDENRIKNANALFEML